MDERYYKFENDREMFHSVIDAGQNTLKACVGCSSLLTVVVAVFTGLLVNHQDVVGTLADALLFFEIAMGLGLIATGLTYCTQVLYQSGDKKRGAMLNTFVAAVVVFSIAGDFIGIVITYLALKGL